MRISDLSQARLAACFDQHLAVLSLKNKKLERKIPAELFFYGNLFKIGMVVRGVLKRSDLHFSPGRYGEIACFEEGKYGTKLDNKSGKTLARLLLCIRENYENILLLPKYLQCDPYIHAFLYLCLEYGCFLYDWRARERRKAAIVCDVANKFLADLRALCSRKDVISLRKNVQRLANANADSTYEFLCEVCRGLNQVRMVRINLYPSLGGADTFDPKAGVAAFRQFLKRTIVPAENMLAYLWHLEYAVSGEVYFHLVLIMRPHVGERWEQKAEEIGKVWLGGDSDGVRGFALCADRIRTRQNKQDGKIEVSRPVQQKFQSVGTGDNQVSDLNFHKKLKAIAVYLTQQERFFRFIEAEGLQSKQSAILPVKPHKTGKRSYVVLGCKRIA